LGVFTIAGSKGGPGQTIVTMLLDGGEEIGRLLVEQPGNNGHTLILVAET